MKLSQKKDIVSDLIRKSCYNLILFTIIFVSISITASSALAIPTLQTYISGATAGSIGSDEDTWFATDSSFSLYVVGAYGSNTSNLKSVTLLVSVPDGEKGTISLSADSGDSTDIPHILTTAGESGIATNPLINANIDILTNEAGNGAGYDGYTTIESNTFLPTGLNLNNHYPLKDNVSDFLLYNLHKFDKVECGLKDYNADNGIISTTSACGEQKEYNVSITGFSWVHFDVYGLEVETTGKRWVRTTWDWENNPGSHDSTARVPEPATLLLLGSGLLACCLIGRRIKS